MSSPVVAGHGLALVEEALLEALRGNRATAAKHMFGLTSRDAAREGLNGLVLIGAGALVWAHRSGPGVEFDIETLANRVQAAAPASRTDDVALFWELLQFVGSLAGGIRQPAEGLATRYSGEQLVYGAFVVASTLIHTVAEVLQQPAEAVMRSAVRWASTD